MSKVYSINDFKAGLDVRKTPLTAPGGSLRILENAVLNQGGEIEKRLAFVPVATIPAGYTYVFGQGPGLHFFAIGSTPAIPPGTNPVPMFGHSLADPGEAVTIIDVEAFDDKFFVHAQGASGTTYTWYDGALVHEVDGSQSHGTYARLYKSKMYRADGNYLRFSGVNNPANNDPSSTTEPGAGFINIARNDPDGEPVEGLEIYYNNMAVMSRLMTQIWTLDPDPNNDTLSQVLRIGTVAPHSIVQFGTGDVLFLSDSGVRSLKAQYINLAASVSDVGSAIDLLLIPIMRANPTATHNARAIVQPIQGRYWLYLVDTIYVLSYFIAGSITAWSTFKPGFLIQQLAVVENRVFALAQDNTLYLYGGPSGADFGNDYKMTVRLPHLSIDAPTENKRVQSVDIMCQGAWSVQIGMLPNNTNAFELVANVQDNTFGLMSIPFAGYGTHVGVHLEHQGDGPAVMAAVHLNIQEGWTK